MINHLKNRCRSDILASSYVFINVSCWHSVSSVVIRITSYFFKLQMENYSQWNKAISAHSTFTSGKGNPINIGHININMKRLTIDHTVKRQLLCYIRVDLPIVSCVIICTDFQLTDEVSFYVLLRLEPAYYHYPLHALCYSMPSNFLPAITFSQFNFCLPLSCGLLAAFFFYLNLHNHRSPLNLII